MSYAPDGQQYQPPYRPEGQNPQQPYGDQYGRRQYGQQSYAPQEPHGGQPYGQPRQPYGQEQFEPQEPYGQEPQYEPRRKSRARRWVIAGVSVLALAGIAAGVMYHFEIPPFTDKGSAVSFGQTPGGGDGKKKDAAQQPANSKMLMPTGPQSEFKNSMTLPDGTHVAVTTLDGKKSGFKGKVWVWAPKEYNDPKFAKSGFPVMIALPGGAGYPSNYWMGTDLGLQTSIAKWYTEGKSKPFILAMPVLNPAPDDKGIYWDGSDIPDQPKMGTWLTEDVPDLMKANFRTVKSRDGWAFMGSSTGGFMRPEGRPEAPGQVQGRDRLRPRHRPGLLAVEGPR